MSETFTTQELRRLCESSGRLSLSRGMVAALVRCAELLENHPGECYELWGNGDANETGDHMGWRDLRDEALAALDGAGIKVTHQCKTCNGDRVVPTGYWDGVTACPSCRKVGP